MPLMYGLSWSLYLTASVSVSCGTYAARGQYGGGKGGQEEGWYPRRDLLMLLMPHTRPHLVHVEQCGVLVVLVVDDLQGACGLPGGGEREGEGRRVKS